MFLIKNFLYPVCVMLNNSLLKQQKEQWHIVDQKKYWFAVELDVGFKKLLIICLLIIILLRVSLIGLFLGNLRLQEMMAEMCKDRGAKVSFLC